MTPKEEAIREVLYKRAEICREARKASLAKRNNETAAYYEGKIDGYMQAYDLLSDSLESIKIELQ